MLRIFFNFRRRLLWDLCFCVLRSLAHYFELLTEAALAAGIIAARQPLSQIYSEAAIQAVEERVEYFSSSF